MFFSVDIWRLIFAYLKVRDLLSLFQACHFFKRLLFLQLRREKLEICGIELYSLRPSRPSLLSTTRILEKENNVLKSGTYTLKENLVIRTSGIYFLIEGDVEFLGEIVVSIYEGTIFKCHFGKLSIYSTLHVLGLGPHFQMMDVSGSADVKINNVSIENIGSPCKIINCPDCSPELLENQLPDPKLGKSKRRQRKENKKILKYNSHRSDQKR